MQVIYKFPIDTTDVQTIELPADAKVLTVQIQDGEPCLWALLDPDATKLGRVIAVVGTGHPIEFKGEYVGTYQLQGTMVFHVFDIAAI